LFRFGIIRMALGAAPQLPFIVLCYTLLCKLGTTLRLAKLAYAVLCYAMVWYAVQSEGTDEV